MINQGLSIWKKKLPAALESGRAQFVEHDFFTPNPVKEADIYLMRNVLFVILPLSPQSRSFTYFLAIPLLDRCTTKADFMM